MNKLTIDSYLFPITSAQFRHVADNTRGSSGWEFDIRADPCPFVDEEDPLWGQEVRFYSEPGDPIPLPHVPDLVGVELFLKRPYDEHTGGRYFTLYVYEHGDLNDLTLRFVERKGPQYRIVVTAKVPAGSVLAHDAELRMDTWIEQLPDGTHD